MRKLNLSAISLAAGLMTLITVSPASAAGTKKPIDFSSTARVIAIPSPTAGQGRQSAYHGLSATNVTVGVETPGVPCGNCIRGAGQPNIGLPWPVFAVTQGTSTTMSVWFEDTLYTGVCTTGLLLKNGPQVVSESSYVFPGGCQPGFLYGVFFTVDTTELPTGFTTVIGSIHGGTNESGANTFINIQVP
jgi:hypothetical protein